MDLRQATETDMPHVVRIWREVGWVDDDDEAEQIPPFVADADHVVAALDGEAECSGTRHAGSLRYLDTDLEASVVTSITTSRIGRRQGLARAVVDRLLLDAAADGAPVSLLGMFEQGFYDRSGYGTGAEAVFHRLDPASLSADLPYRRPVRLSEDDAGEMTATHAGRWRGHGGVVLPSVAMASAELAWTEGGFGLGYRDDAGVLTHFVWMSAKGEHGPYRVRLWAWHDHTQLRELLGALRSLGDQVRSLTVPEPWCLQLQVLTELPGRQHLLTKGTETSYLVDADAWWQARVLDVPTAVAAMRPLAEAEVRLTVTDPLADRHGFDAVAGDWTLRLEPGGATVTRGHDGTPDVTCSVNTLTRVWLGVRAPSVVLATDGVEVAPDLARDLDAALVLPRPDVGMNF